MRSCGNCKYLNSAKGTTQKCFHPKQMNEGYLMYCFPSFSCDLFTPGISETDIELFARGYIKKYQIIKRLDGATESWAYFEKQL